LRETKHNPSSRARPDQDLGPYFTDGLSLSEAKDWLAALEAVSDAAGDGWESFPKIVFFFFFFSPHTTTQKWVSAGCKPDAPDAYVSGFESPARRREELDYERKI